MERFGYPFNNLTNTPQKQSRLFLAAPYCTNKLGQPVPCPMPCQGRFLTCNWDFPVPVFGVEQGPYTPTKWCPGAPLC